MISLAIGDLRHNPAFAWLTLAETGMLPGLVGTLYDPQPGQGGIVEEHITLVMRGSQAQIALVMRRLEEKIALANRHNDEGVGDAQYLRVSTDVEENFWYSRILHARLAAKANSLHYISGGSLGVELILTRENHFDGEAIVLPIANVHGGVTGTPLQVDNCQDASHDNRFGVQTSDLVSALPAPIRLEISNNSSTYALKDLFIGSYQFNNLGNTVTLNYEAEAGTGGSSQSSAGCSGGQFQRLQWSDAGWQNLLAWQVTSQNLTRFAGRALLPLIRLANAHAYADLQLRLVMKVGAVTLYEGAPVWADPACGYVRFAPFRMPTVPLSGENSVQAQTLHLWGKKAQSDPYTLDVDFLQWLPLDSFSHYQGLVTLPEGDGLVDDAFDGTFYGMQDGYELSTHISMAHGHFIRAEHFAQFVVFQTHADGSAPIAQSVGIKAWYRPRKRVL